MLNFLVTQQHIIPIYLLSIPLTLYHNIEITVSRMFFSYKTKGIVSVSRFRYCERESPAFEGYDLLLHVIKLRFFSHIRVLI